jgi:hypothetical protein
MKSLYSPLSRFFPILIVILVVIKLAQLTSQPTLARSVITPPGEENVAPPYYVNSQDEWFKKLSDCWATGKVDGECYFEFGFNSMVNALAHHVEEGAGTTNSLNTALLLNPPASSKEYLAYMSNKNIVKPVYAQGLGFSALSPILKLWVLFRNVAYLFFVIIFAVVGMMVILRRRIDPRTVVTIQDSLPRIVVALLLVTFSYAIAGLIIDLGELTIRITGNLLQQQGFIAQTTQPRQSLAYLFSTNMFELMSPLSDTHNLKEALKGVPVPIIGKDVRIPILSGLTTWVVIDLTMFFVQFKIFFALLGPYVAVALGVIFSPFYLLLAALPGGGDRVGSWLRSMISNVVVFPAIFAVLAIAAILKGNAAGAANVWQPNPANTSNGFWSPAVLGNWGGAVGDLLAFGILLGTPKIAQDIKEKLGQRPSGATQEAQTALAGAIRRIPIVGGFIGG